jgi:peptidoglycan/LPS O-acetylase OafA/YrhL
MTAATRPTPLHIPSLDGIRGLSFLIVFVAHAGLARWVPGGFGVTVFFFLSGYLITTLLRLEQERHGHINVRHFWLRRVLRILPPFYLVLLAATTATLLAGAPFHVKAAPLLAQLLHVTNYWTVWHGTAGMPEGTGIYWSLAVEEHFYLLFPWLFIGMQRAQLKGHQQALLLWGLCVLALAWRCLLVWHWHVDSDRTYMGSDTRLDSIVFGCALAVWKNPILDAPTAGIAHRWQFIWVPGSLALLVACLVFRNEAFRETFRYSLQGVALTVLFIAAVRQPQWPMFRWLNSRLMKRLGSLSYALYLVHFTVLLFLARFLPAMPDLLRGVLSLGLALLLAQASYRWIEQPCARLRRRLVD